MTISRDGILLVSNSEIQTFKSCRRRWWLAWYRGLRPRVAKLDTPAATGTRIHAALAAFYTPPGETSRNPLDALRELIAEDERRAHALIAEWEQSDEERRDSASPVDVVKLTKNFDMERAMIEGYVEWLAETGEDSDLEVIAAESYVEVPLNVDSRQLAYVVGRGYDVRLIGKLDVQVRHLITGLRAFIDHKSVQSLQDPMLGLNQQMLHYTLIQRLTEPDSPVGGVYYNMLRKVKRTRTSRPPYFARRFIRYNDFEIENYRRKLIGTITDMVEVMRRLDGGLDHQAVAYPTPHRDCVWKCQFFKICRMFDDGSRAEDAVSELYVEGDPLSYYSGSENVDDED